MMESLLLFIIDHPGANLEYIYEHYKCVLQPVAIDDCIELFQQMNCLETVRVSLKRTVEKQINLYSNENSDDDEMMKNKKKIFNMILIMNLKEFYLKQIMIINKQLFIVFQLMIVYQNLVFHFLHH